MAGRCAPRDASTPRAGRPVYESTMTMAMRVMPDSGAARPRSRATSTRSRRSSPQRASYSGVDRRARRRFAARNCHRRHRLPLATGDAPRRPRRAEEGGGHRVVRAGASGSIGTSRHRPGCWPTTPTRGSVSRGESAPAPRHRGSRLRRRGRPRGTYTQSRDELDAVPDIDALHTDRNARRRRRDARRGP